MISAKNKPHGGFWQIRPVRNPMRRVHLKVSGMKRVRQLQKMLIQNIVEDVQTVAFKKCSVIMNTTCANMKLFELSAYVVSITKTGTQKL